jgi:hypothetical protein
MISDRNAEDVSDEEIVVIDDVINVEAEVKDPTSQSQHDSDESRKGENDYDAENATSTTEAEKWKWMRGWR